MTIKINKHICNGCGNREETFCEMVCPGNLLYKGQDNKAHITDKRDCYDCAACVKECPRSAIEMYNQAQVGGRGSTLKAKKTNDGIVWTIKKPNGTEEVIEAKNSKVL